jgi:cytochrome P450
MGPRLFAIVEKLDVVQEILVKKFDCFTDRMVVIIYIYANFNDNFKEMNFLSDSLSQSLVNARGGEWRRMRQCLSPTFTGSKMRRVSNKYANFI